MSRLGSSSTLMKVLLGREVRIVPFLFMLGAYVLLIVSILGVCVDDLGGDGLHLTDEVLDALGA